MSETRHTLGPWRIGSSARIVMAGMGNRVATITQCDEDGANARLIAAAPLLLEAAKTARAKFAEYYPSRTGPLPEAVQMLDRAIAVAEPR